MSKSSQSKFRLSGLQQQRLLELIGVPGKSRRRLFGRLENIISTYRNSRMTKESRSEDDFLYSKFLSIVKQSEKGLHLLEDIPTTYFEEGAAHARYIAAEKVRRSLRETLRLGAMAVDLVKAGNGRPGSSFSAILFAANIVDEYFEIDHRMPIASRRDPMFKVVGLCLEWAGHVTTNAFKYYEHAVMDGWFLERHVSVRRSPSEFLSL